MIKKLWKKLFPPKPSRHLVLIDADKIHTEWGIYILQKPTQQPTTTLETYSDSSYEKIPFRHYCIHCHSFNTHAYRNKSFDIKCCPTFAHSSIYSDTHPMYQAAITEIHRENTLRKKATSDYLRVMAEFNI